MRGFGAHQCRGEAVDDSAFLLRLRADGGLARCARDLKVGPPVLHPPADRGLVAVLEPGRFPHEVREGLARRVGGDHLVEDGARGFLLGVGVAAADALPIDFEGARSLDRCALLRARGLRGRALRFGD